jgi:hypothetical protein
MPTIEIYPQCPKPDWMKVGATCFCLGEAQDVFIVDTVGNNAAFLVTSGKKRLGHGWESFTKLYKNIQELDARRTK